MPSNAAPPIHVIIKLPYNRPEGAVDPPIVLWTPEKEATLWDIISRYRGSDSAGIDWPALSAHLQVPLPFLMYRAQVRYEEDLRGLQGTLGASVATIPTRPSQEARPTRPTISTPTKPSTTGLRTPQQTSLSQQSTPINFSKNKLLLQHRSPHGLQSSQIFQREPPLSASTSTFQQRTPASRVLTLSPLNTRRAPTPPSPSSPSSSSSDEGDKEKEESREQVGRQLKELEKMMSSQMLGFARPKGDPSKARERLTMSIIKETTRPESKTPDSKTIPSIPSPPGEQGSFVGTPRGPRAAFPGRAPVSKSPPHSPPHQIVRNKMVGKQPTPTEKSSNQGSSASSFSDISDASVSTSALEDALNSNFKRGDSSRISSFNRGFSRTSGF
ncbi:hypothetical protein CPB86DRAFT_754611 [Serendipita vermifera]|nr:hypothetical protein CPB86DRAFT_754611 [Serendipita vermifera]